MRLLESSRPQRRVTFADKRLAVAGPHYLGVPTYDDSGST